MEDELVKNIESAIVCGVLVGVVEGAIEKFDSDAAKAGAVAGVSSFIVHELVTVANLKWMDDGMLRDLVNAVLVGLLYSSVEKWAMKREGFVRHLLEATISDWVAKVGVDKVNVWLKPSEVDKPVETAAILSE